MSSGGSLISCPLTATNSIKQYSRIKLDLSESPLQQTNPYNKTKWPSKRLWKKIDLRCRCCDNNPLRKSSKTLENSCRFFARGIVLAQIFCSPICKISLQLAGRNSRLRLNDFRSLQSTNPSVPHCIQQFPFFLLRSPKSHQLILSMDEIFFLDSVYYG